MSTSREAQAFTTELRHALEQAADAARAAAMSAYMKRHFAFFGIPKPARAALQKPVFALLGRNPAPSLLTAIAQGLWQYPERECQYAGCDLLIRHAARLEAGDLQAVADLITQRSWWDTVDALATRVVGELAARHPALLPTLDAWAVDDNLWLRRSALLYALHHGPATDRNRLQAALDANLGHGDFFIRKAMGWALRQFARHDPDWVRHYLASRGEALSGLTRREAARHL
ncbi:DNA alkylation repair protein [Uliginosibacterium sp. H1]|uniref:DNA alkylation repair protein n=1 Tax=Uliginosibacterium sp. H1 TaxID=3114757 RepID=UPI002E17B4A0|nr:DNA alkylation repair protein [Uliginosibacterium sp. H1]